MVDTQTDLDYRVAELIMKLWEENSNNMGITN